MEINRLISFNWLTNGGSTTKATNIFKTFEGATLTMGFASTMYLDHREGTLYGQKLMAGLSIRRAFIDAAKKYQTQRSSGNSIARVQGYTSAKDDTIFNYYSNLATIFWYKNSPSIYSTMETCTIPYNGVIL